MTYVIFPNWLNSPTVLITFVLFNRHRIFYNSQDPNSKRRNQEVVRKL